mmetsp:Transcript_21200/g.35421  ORF Transcript_21200/g.35421 Transcript_21200/m.35421 type:complete len:289 (-) Transcript_21200:23-889(-)
MEKSCGVSHLTRSASLRLSSSASSLSFLCLRASAFVLSLSILVEMSFMFFLIDCTFLMYSGTLAIVWEASESWICCTLTFCWWMSSKSSYWPFRSSRTRVSTALTDSLKLPRRPLVRSETASGSTEGVKRILPVLWPRPLLSRERVRVKAGEGFVEVERGVVEAPDEDFGPLEGSVGRMTKKSEKALLNFEIPPLSDFSRVGGGVCFFSACAAPSETPLEAAGSCERIAGSAGDEDEDEDSSFFGSSASSFFSSTSSLCLASGSCLSSRAGTSSCSSSSTTSLWTSSV